MTTQTEFEEILQRCESVFRLKMKDYGTAWRVLRPSSLTDQIYIKANRIRTLQMKGETRVGEGITPEFIGIVNYALMALIQLERGAADGQDQAALHDESVIDDYRRQAQATLELMLRKNHDYDEAWRLMRVTSMTDLILMKVFRTKEIESNDGKTLVSEGVAANYQDMINYSVFLTHQIGVGRRRRRGAERALVVTTDTSTERFPRGIEPPLLDP